MKLTSLEQQEKKLKDDAHRLLSKAKEVSGGLQSPDANPDLVEVCQRGWKGGAVAGEGGGVPGRVGRWRGRVEVCWGRVERVEGWGGGGGGWRWGGTKGGWSYVGMWSGGGVE